MNPPEPTQLPETTAEGFLVDASAWNEAVAEWLAARIPLTLDQRHWEILYFLRDYHARFRHLPSNRLFVKAVAHGLGPERGHSRYLNGLFPGNPARLACLLAGLPKPPGCP